LPNNERELERGRRERRRNAGKQNRTRQRKPKSIPLTYGMKKAIAVAVGVVFLVVVIVILILVFSRDNAIAIYLNGTRMGVLRLSGNETLTANEIFNIARAQESSRVGTTVVTDDVVTVDRVRSGRNDFVTTDFVVGELRRNMVFKLETAAVYIDGQLAVIVINQHEAEAGLQRVKDRFHQTDELIDIREEYSRFVENVEIRTFITEETDDIYCGNQAYLLLGGDVEREWVYTVRADDTLGAIANDHGMRLERLISLNYPRFNVNTTIRPGDRITLVTEEPLLSVKTFEFREFIEIIPRPVEYVFIPEQPATFRRVINQGTDGEKRVTAFVVRINGFVQEEREIIGEPVVLRQPVTEIIERGGG